MSNNTKLTQPLKDKAKRIKLIVMDVDGVLTQGHIVMDASGREIKFFDVQDGFGLFLWRKAGFKSAIITAGDTVAVKKRADYLKIDVVYQNVHNKLASYKKLKDKFRINDSEICFIGDDLMDLPLLKKAGLSCCVSNARADIMPCAHYVSRREGGRGAVREIIELILKSKGLWGKVTGDYFTTG